jgi:hypothetical protein
MAKVFLLISRPRTEFTHLQVKCAISGSTGGANVANVKDREFAGPFVLEDALRSVGVSEYDSQAAHHVFHSGLPTFIPVTAELARKLGVLE